MNLLRFFGAGEGIRILGNESALHETAVFKPQNDSPSSVSTSLRTLQDDSGTFHRTLLDANQHRINRLERLAVLDRSARPALAAARALEAAYERDDVASEAALADMAEALGGARW
ncbi:MAG: hypothetical protein WDO69_18595 [Pseudomonadota bacterium]